MDWSAIIDYHSMDKMYRNLAMKLIQCLHCPRICLTCSKSCFPCSKLLIRFLNPVSVCLPQNRLKSNSGVIRWGAGQIRWSSCLPLCAVGVVFGAKERRPRHMQSHCQCCFNFIFDFSIPCVLEVDFGKHMRGKH